MFYTVPHSMPKKCRVAIDWAINDLGFDDEVTIDFHLKSLKGQAGNVLQEDRYEDDLDTFTIEVDRSLAMGEKIVTIFHELVHVQQYLRGEDSKSPDFEVAAEYRARSMNKRFTSVL